MKLEIWSLGKKNEQFIEDGLAFYFKKIRPYYSIELKIIDNKKLGSITNKEMLKKEEELLILPKINSDNFLILLDEKGKMFDSFSFAATFQKCLNVSPKQIIFLIGGAFGVSEEVYKRANLIWSFSKQVFPHQLMRIMVAEQIYRTLSILNHSPYHHE